MGDLWRGTDRELRREVAVKLMRFAVPELARRFEREAEIAAKLQHPGITVVYDRGWHADQPFIVMELLLGQDLARLVEENQAGLAVDYAVQLTIQAAEALQAAHNHHVVHRDLKPANLFLQQNGMLKICDFGIARAADMTTSLTSTGTVIGTPLYMAPEQWQGEQADERSDLYSLGCVLYELLTGQPPFLGDLQSKVMFKHLYVLPDSPRERRPDIPTQLDQLILDLLAKDPAGRPPSAAHVVAILKGIKITAPRVGGHVSASHQATEPSRHSAYTAGPAEPGIGRAGTRMLHWRDRVVGIDLGAAQSVIAVKDASGPAVIANAEGSHCTPSVVAFAADGEVLVGEVARQQEAGNADRTIRSVTRQLGTGWLVEIDGRKYTAQQISAFILKKLKLDAEAYVGETITEAVISVPAYLGRAQRQAVKEAGHIAGLNIVRVVSEPSLAATAYYWSNPAEATVLVFGLGGGSLSIALVEVGDDVVEVKAVGGDDHLGGDDWDQRIVNWLVKDFKKGNRIDLSSDEAAMRRLREAAERAKIELSGSAETTIDLPAIVRSRRRPRHLNARLTRAEFQEMTSDLIDRCKARLQQVIKDSDAMSSAMQHVVLVGGSTRMPAVVNAVKELTGRQPSKGVDPEEVVAVGACLRAGVPGDMLLLDAIPRSLGIEAWAPSTAGSAPALGGGSIRAEGRAGFYTRIIERNATFPSKRSAIFTTAADNQLSVTIQAFEGDREIAAYNEKLGMFELGGLAPARRGTAQIEVTFDLDTDGALKASAEDLSTGRQRSVAFSGSVLDVQEFRRMVAEVEDYAERYRLHPRGS
jgi:molecular chaperone DnaK